MDTTTGRDARFNLGYNMSLLGGDTSPDMYGGRPSATSLSPGMSRAGMGGGLSGACPSAGPPRGIKRTSSDVCFLDQDVGGRGGGLDCGSDLMDDGFSPAPQKSGPPPNGKKTKGRVKIKMEYIDNKLRRYTTFSKRKTGIMKKAYELSTLTGTQVMLLVASETGHVYTFATRKLQPMITSEAGKALIQTCLNSPDPCPSSSGGGGGGDQRMSATGFEETELSYNIGDDDQKQESDDAMPSPRSVDDGDLSGGESSGQESPRALSPEPSAPPAKFNIPEMIRAAGIRNVLSKGGGGSVLEPPSAPEAHQQSSTSSPITLSSSSPSLISTPYSGVMYQTAQGLVYATPGTSLQNGVILSLPPGIQLQTHNEANGSSSSSSAQAAAAAVLRQPQFIRIPFPMTLSDPQVSVASQSRNISSEAADLSKGRK